MPVRALTPSTRTEQKHQAILDAASTLFLANGFAGTSMDEVAARAQVSKQTVYKHFGDKESLFLELVSLAVAGTAESTAAIDIVIGDNVAEDLSAFARHLARGVMRPEVLNLRRLVIAEAGRFPALGRRFHDLGLARTVERLTAVVEDLQRRGILHVDDVSMAAHHLNWLILSVPLNQAMLLGNEHAIKPRETDRYANAGVEAFLRAYGT